MEFTQIETPIGILMIQGDENGVSAISIKDELAVYSIIGRHTLFIHLLFRLLSLKVHLFRF